MENLMNQIEKTTKNLEAYSKTHLLPKTIREDISNLTKIVDEMKKAQKETKKNLQKLVVSLHKEKPPSQLYHIKGF